jgi:hypothetical protein
MFKYFKELLDTLKSIDKTNKEISINLQNIDNNLSKCVVCNKHRHGKNAYLATGHWNE